MIVLGRTYTWAGRRVRALRYDRRYGLGATIVRPVDERGRFKSNVTYVVGPQEVYLWVAPADRIPSTTPDDPEA